MNSFFFLRSSPPFRHPYAGIFSFSTAYSIFTESRLDVTESLFLMLRFNVFGWLPFHLQRARQMEYLVLFCIWISTAIQSDSPFPYTTVAFHFASSVFRLAGLWKDGADGVMTDDWGCDGVEIDETLPRRALCPTQTCLLPESLLWGQSSFACKIWKAGI